MAEPDPTPRARTWTRGTVLTMAVLAAVAAAGVTALLVNIMERKQEAKNPFFRVVELDDETEDPAIWGKNFPLQYDAYLRTVDQQRTKYGGSEALPHAPTEADPRSVVAQSRLDEDPRLKRMWAGYAFSVDFRKKRGHAYMLEDQTFTERVEKFKQPGTCIHCHGSVYVPYRKAGGGDLIKGFEHYNQMPYQEARKDFTASHRLHRLPRPGHDGAAGHAARLPGGHPRLEGEPGGEGLRREQHGHAPGDAQLRLRPVPRGVLLQGRREAPHLPLGQGAHRGQDRGLLRRGRLQGLGPRGDRDRAAQGAAPRVRDVEPGDPRPLGRGLRGLPHAVHARGRPEDQRPPRAQPAPQHQQRLPDLPQVARAGAARAGGDDPGPHRQPAQPRHGRAHGPDHRHQGGEGGRGLGRRLEGGAGRPAPRAVLPGLRGVGELQRLPCAPGGGEDPGRGHRPLPAGTGLAAAPEGGHPRAGSPGKGD